MAGCTYGQGASFADRLSRLDPTRKDAGGQAGDAMAPARTTRAAIRFILRSLWLMGSWWVVRGQGAAGSPYRRISQTPA